MNYDFDIAVIGGGPAGSVTAIRLAEMGYAVCILEALAFPRQHHGICLSDETNAVLEYIGVEKAMEAAAFLKRKVTMVRWDKAEPVRAEQPGFHVDRGQFDQILLEKARMKDVTILQPAKAKRAVESEDGWEVHYEIKGALKELKVRFLVEASGHHSVIPAKKTRNAPPLFAMHAYWELKSIPEYDGFIEAGEDAWLWFAKVNGNKALITLFTDPKHFSKSQSETLQEHYMRMFAQFSLLEYCQLGAPVSPFKSCDASSRHTTDPVGVNYIRVGDANVSVDPIASQGVHLAMTSALQAATVVNTLLKHPEDGSLAMEFYKERQQERVVQFTQRTAEAYQQVSLRKSDDFWSTRALHEKHLKEVTLETDLPYINAEFTLCSSVEIKPIPVMKGNRIDRDHALYHPNLTRPVAYLGGVPITDILHVWKEPISGMHFMQDWSLERGADHARQLFHWLWQHGIITLIEKEEEIKLAEVIVPSEN